MSDLKMPPRADLILLDARRLLLTGEVGPPSFKSDDYGNAAVDAVVARYGPGGDLMEKLARMRTDPTEEFRVLAAATDMACDYEHAAQNKKRSRNRDGILH